MSTPFIASNYYSNLDAKDKSYIEYMRIVSNSINSHIENSANRQIAANAMFTKELQSTLIDNQIATENALYNHTQQINGTLMDGFSGVNSGLMEISRQLGSMGSAMNMGFAFLNNAVQESTKAICEKLDNINETLKNPLYTESRELYNRALQSYNKRLYKEALEDLQEAIKKNKTDPFSNFLLGQIYFYGMNKYDNVIDLNAAIEYLKNAAKYIEHDANNVQLISYPGINVVELEEYRKMDDSQKISALKLIREKTGWGLKDSKDYYENGIIPNCGENQSANINPARLLAAEIWFYLGLAYHTKANDTLYNSCNTDYKKFLNEAKIAYRESYNYSQEMLESLYNLARCKALFNETDEAIKELIKITIKDHGYCFKVFRESDFDSVFKDKYFIELKKEIYPKTRIFFDRIENIRINFKSHYSPKLSRLIKTYLPNSYTENTPVFDMLKASIYFPEILSALEEENEKILNVNKDEYNRLVTKMDCILKISDYDDYLIRQYQDIAKRFREMNDYENSTELANECDEALYNILVRAMNEVSTKNDYQYLAEQFRKMNGYKNTSTLANKCDNKG